MAPSIKKIDETQESEEFTAPTREKFDAILKALNEAPPAEAISQRKGPGGKTFTYLTGGYVIRRANELFGPDGWQQMTTVTPLGNGEYMANVKVRVHSNGNDWDVVSFNSEQSGIGYGSGETETAIKGAETDGMKRAFMKFGKTFGLELYPVSGNELSGGDTDTASDNQKRFIATLMGERDVQQNTVLLGKTLDTLSRTEAKAAIDTLLATPKTEGQPTTQVGLAISTSSPSGQRQATERQVATLEKMWDERVKADEDGTIAIGEAAGAKYTYPANPDELPKLSFDGMLASTASALIGDLGKVRV